MYKNRCYVLIQTPIVNSLHEWVVNWSLVKHSAKPSQIGSPDMRNAISTQPVDFLLIWSTGSDVAAERRQGLSLVLRDETNKAERSTAFIKDDGKTTIPWLWEFLVH